MNATKPHGWLVNIGPSNGLVPLDTEQLPGPMFTKLLNGAEPYSDDMSTLAQVMDSCSQATSRRLSQSWPRSVSPYGVTRPHWVNAYYRNPYLCLAFQLCRPVLQLWLFHQMPLLPAIPRQTWLPCRVCLPYQACRYRACTSMATSTWIGHSHSHQVSTALRRWHPISLWGNVTLGNMAMHQVCDNFFCLMGFHRGQFWPSGIVVAWVCLSVRVCGCVSVTSLSMLSTHSS